MLLFVVPWFIFVVPWLALLPAGEAPQPQPIVGNAEAGRAQFKRCQPCHEITQELNKVGPHLVGVVGRPAAGARNFAYSDAMVKAGAGGLVWTGENLTAFLKAPRQFVVGNSMSAAPMKDDQAVADLIAYMSTQPEP